MPSDESALPIWHEHEASAHQVAAGSMILGEDGEYYRARKDRPDRLLFQKADPDPEETVEAFVERAKMADEVHAELRSGKTLWPADNVTTVRRKGFQARKRAREVLADA